MVFEWGIFCHHYRSLRSDAPSDFIWRKILGGKLIKIARTECITNRWIPKLHAKSTPRNAILEFSVAPILKDLFQNILHHNTVDFEDSQGICKRDRIIPLLFFFTDKVPSGENEGTILENHYNSSFVTFRHSWLYLFVSLMSCCILVTLSCLWHAICV